MRDESNVRKYLIMVMWGFPIMILAIIVHGAWFSLFAGAWAGAAVVAFDRAVKIRDNYTEKSNEQSKRQLEDVQSSVAKSDSA